MPSRRWRGLLWGILAVCILDVLVLAIVLGRALEDGRADLRFSQGAEVATLDPAKMTALIDGRVASALFEGLTVVEPATQKARPGVARSWDVSPDGLVYSFRLRDDARWSDGSPVTAGDFRYAWRRALHARTAAQYNYMLFPIRGAEAFAKATAARLSGDAVPLPDVGIEVVSPTELRVLLNQPTHYFLELVAFSTYLPVKQSCVETVRDGKTVDDKQWVFPGRIVSNGPYVLTEWVYKSRMRLTKNPHYWNRDAVRVGTIDIFPIEELNTCLVGYERGELDFITAIPTLAAEELLRRHKAGKRPDFAVAPNLGTYYYRFNCTRKPLDDPRVRKALALALDKQEIVTKAGRIGQPVTGVLVPPGVPGYTGAEGLGHDPELARRLLTEAGFPGGKGFPKLALLYNTSEGHKKVAELAQVSWRRELGVTVELTNVEWKVFLDRCNKLDYDVARAGWYGDYVDPNTFLDMFVTGGGNNNTGWSNAEYDRLIARAARTLDAGERMRVFRDAEVILTEQEVPILPIYNYVGAMLAKPHVKGWHPNLRNDILFQELWVERPEAGR